MSEKICPIMTEPIDDYVTEKGMVCQKEKCQWWWKCREPEKQKGTIDVYCRACEHEQYPNAICKKYKCGLLYVMGQTIRCQICIADKLNKDKEANDE